jgi:hypothetical protein
MMGMFDTIFILDTPGLRCPEGHTLRSFQTKDLAQPAMSTYLMHVGQLYLATAEPHADDADATGWRIDAGRAIHERRYELCDVRPPRTLRIYTSCSACEPVLVRSDAPDVWGDIVREHALFVDFTVTLRPGEAAQIERTSGTRGELKHELRKSGVFVLEDDDSLAVAHRTLRQARERVGGA